LALDQTNEGAGTASQHRFDARPTRSAMTRNLIASCRDEVNRLARSATRTRGDPDVRREQYRGRRLPAAQDKTVIRVYLYGKDSDVKDVH